MAEITIKLVYNLNTGKQDVFIDFISDEDALPIEHERDHRSIIEALIGQGALSTDSVGDIVIKRLGHGDLGEVSREVLAESGHLLDHKA